MTRKYLPVILQLKEKGVASITVSEANLRSAIQGVKRLKSEDNMMRKATGLMRFSRLEIEKESIGKSLWKVTFRFTYATHHL